MDGNFDGTTDEGGLIKKVQRCTYGYGGCGVIYKITPSGKYKSFTRSIRPMARIPTPLLC
jgi:hypothetical protein